MADVKLRLVTEADTSGLRAASQATEGLTHSEKSLAAALKQAIIEANEASRAQKGVADSARKAKGDVDDFAKAAQKAKDDLVSFAKNTVIAYVGVQALTGFIKDSVQAFTEQERADKQLALVAGSLTEAFKAQAAALQETLGVSDDMVQGLQTALLRFGAAPAQVDATTRAVLDFATATGQDAQSALNTLIRGVQSGDESLGKLGVRYEATGSFTKDLAAATAALSEKFGGAAAANTETYAGRVAKLDANVGELKEEFGRLAVEAATSTGVIDKLTQAIVFWRTQFDELSGKKGLGGTSGADSRAVLERDKKQLEKDLESLTDQATQAQNANDSAKLAGLQVQLATTRANLDATRRQLGFEAQDEESRKKKGNDPLSGDDKTDRARKDEEAKEKARQQRAKDRAEREKEELEEAAAAVERWGKRKSDMADAAVNAQIDGFKKEEKDRKDAEKRAEKEQKAKHKEFLRQLKEHAEAVETQEKAFAEAGAAVGSAFVAGLSEQFNNLKQGQSFDFGALLKAVLPLIISAALQAYGVPAPLATMAGQGVGLALSAFHDGGWVGPQGQNQKEPMRFHDGGEVPAMLLPGERVLSHKEIQNIGGMPAVEQMARGQMAGNSVTLAISTMDSKSFSDFMGDRGGAGLARTVMQGRGEAAQLIRRLQRGKG